MATYCEIDDVAKKVLDVTDAEIDPDHVITPAIDEAESFVDGYLNDYYTVPFTGTIPSLVKYITIKLAASECLRRIFQDKSNELSSIASEWRTEAIDTLRKIQEREISIPGETRTG